jgi:hypothetical protein
MAEQELKIIFDLEENVTRLKITFFQCILAFG